MNDNPRLQTESNIWLATTRPNGKPHLIPIWFVWLDERAYICTGESSVKVKNLRADPRATIALEDGNQPVIAESSATFVPQPFPADVAAAFQHKYNWNIASPISAAVSDHVLIALQPEKWLTWTPQ
jgi:F420H(2)-dependent biliverdin reductase